MTTAHDIARTIIASDFSNDDITVIEQAIRFHRQELIRKNTGSLVKGTRVNWMSSRTRQIMSGTVEKVGRKFITVSTNLGSWRVPANMLKRA